MLFRSKICDFKISSEFTGKGIGTEMMYTLFGLFKELEIHSVVGICKPHSRPLHDKENLAGWYESLGFTLNRKCDDKDPGYMGRLYKEL